MFYMLYHGPTSEGPLCVSLDSPDVVSTGSALRQLHSNVLYFDHRILSLGHVCTQSVFHQFWAAGLRNPEGRRRAAKSPKIRRAKPRSQHKAMVLCTLSEAYKKIPVAPCPLTVMKPGVFASLLLTHLRRHVCRRPCAKQQSLKPQDPEAHKP